MATSNVAIQATANTYFGLRHPAGYELDAAGRGEWPADSFTFALLRDHVFELSDEPIPPPPVYAPTTQDTFFYIRDGRYVSVAAAALAPVLAPLVDGEIPDTTAPTITTSASQTVAENATFFLTLTANEAVSWLKTGGADAALFTLVGPTLSMAAKDFESPTDANADNAYVVQVTATDAAGNATPLTITVTVSNVVEIPAGSAGTLNFSAAANSGLIAAIAA